MASRYMPGEQHDLGLIAFGLGLRERGWRITFLGPDTLTETVTTLRPDAVVLAATTPERFETGRDPLRRLARAVPLWVAGAGATSDFAARLLDLDPLAAAGHIAAAIAGEPRPPRAGSGAATGAR